MRYDYASQLVLPIGYQIVGEFSGQSGVITVPSGAGVAGVAQKEIFAQNVPPGAKAYVSALTIRVVDAAAYDQLYFVFRRNGCALTPWHRISGEQVSERYDIPVEQAFDAGEFSLTGINISGANDVVSWPGAAADAVDIRVIARMQGYLLGARR